MHEVIDLCNDAESDADSDIVELSPVVFATTVKQERRTPPRSSVTPNYLAPNRQGAFHPDLVTRNQMLSTVRANLTRNHCPHCLDRSAPFRYRRNRTRRGGSCSPATRLELEARC